MANCIVIGRGNIGLELMLRLEAEGHLVLCSVNSRASGGLYMGNIRARALNFQHGDGSGTGVFAALDSVREKAKQVDIAFLAIPTNDRGEWAYSYMEYFLSNHIPVVTCEKGALAYHFETLLPLLDLIGSTATVGGGSRILPYLEKFDFSQGKWSLEAVLNGTLNYIWSGLNAERALATLVSEARRLGYAEPNGGSELDLVLGEISDVKKKASVLFNRVLARKNGPFLTPGMFQTEGIMGPSDLHRLVNSPEKMRYIVTFSNIRNGASSHSSDSPGSFSAECDEWRICTGFMPVRRWLPEGVDNCIRIIDEKGNGPYRIEGPGAGAVPTVDAMMSDMRRLLTKR